MNLHAGPGEPALLDTASALLAAGAEVRAGWLDAGFDVARDGWNPAAVAAAFHEFGRTAVRPIFGENGRFAAALSSDGATFANKRVALWIVLTSGNALAGPYSNVTAHALVTSTDARWTFPTATALPPLNATTLALGEADDIALGVANPGGGGSAASLALAETGYRYTAWRDARFAAGAADSAPGDDADGDRVTNLVEFFAGTDPLVANAPPVTVGVENSGGQRWLVLTLTQSPWARGTATDLEESVDQVVWTPVASPQLSGDGTASLAQTARVPAPNTAAGERRYLRAVVRSVP